ncbi:MAG: hypothetical protein AAFX99_04050, partial [Myxococcota bacterium]
QLAHQGRVAVGQLGIGIDTATERQLAPYVNKSIYGTLPLDIPRLLRMFQDLNAEDNSDLLLDLTLNTLLRCARVLPNEDELDVRATPLQQPRLDDVVAFDVATLMRGCSNLVGLNAPLGTFSDRFLRATRSKAQSIRQLYRLRDPVDAWLPYGSDDPISALELQQLIQALRATADLHIALAPPGLMTHVILTNALWCVIIDNARALVLKYPIQHATWAVDALNTIKLDAAREHSS